MPELAEIRELRHEFARLHLDYELRLRRLELELQRRPTPWSALVRQSPSRRVRPVAVAALVQFLVLGSALAFATGFLAGSRP